jgi:hypothetical protein
MSVYESVERDLKNLGLAAQKSTLGATALALAAELDDSETSATAKSMCAKSMVDVFREIRALTPPKKERDGLDDLSARREARRSGRAAAAHSART